MGPTNKMAKASSGQRGQQAPKASTTSPMTTNIYGTDPLANKPKKAPKAVAGGSGASIGQGSSSSETPAGYDGASLAAGGE